MSVLHVGPVREGVHRVRVDLAIVGFFEDERPLRGRAGLVDWRLCGRISRLIRAGRIAGAAGEAMLIPGQGGLRAAWVLVLGLGAVARFDPQVGRVAVCDALRRAAALRVHSLALPFPFAKSSEGGLENCLNGLLEDASAVWEETRDRPESLTLALVCGSEDRRELVRALRARATTVPAGMRIQLPEEGQRESEPPGGEWVARADS